MSSHHKGSYKIANGSDRERGGVRRGPRKKALKIKLREAAVDLAVRIAAAKMKALRKSRVAAMHAAGLQRKRRSGPSHHKGTYEIRNGSESEPGGIRRGPPTLKDGGRKRKGMRERWRRAKRAQRGK